MTIATINPSVATRSAARVLSPGWARGFVVLAIIAGGLGAFMTTDTAASARAVVAAGDDLTRLLRAMAAIKAAMGVAAAAAVFWRLGVPIAAPRMALYAAACAGMAAGPALIWTLTHLAAGALLLHAGLAVTVVLLWRDPAVGARLSAIIAEKRRPR